MLFLNYNFIHYYPKTTKANAVLTVRIKTLTYLMLLIYSADAIYSADVIYSAVLTVGSYYFL